MWTLEGIKVNNLRFKGPCIVIYSYNKSQQDALFLKFILVNKSTYFGQTYYRLFFFFFFFLLGSQPIVGLYFAAL